MRVYSTKRFFAFVLLSGIVGAVIAGFATWGVNTLFPVGIPRVYCQIVDSQSLVGDKPKPYPWAQVNYTVVILNDTVIDGIINVTAVLEPPREWGSARVVNFTVKNSFYIDCYDYIVPTLIDGTLSWSGDMHANQSKMLRVTLTLDKGDGMYCIGGGTGWIRYFQTIGGEISHKSEGIGAAYWILVENEKIVKVMDYVEYVEWKLEH
ncbi:MAG: hypothetical protein OEZ29_01925 [Candidatus Bathyarchaeota archaeon]|nr:hypothetical protein [Candidatus Bathyarchaeota archaeon]MDH5779335.1 hypothetical protein [Candidatus Bathyarchaeota archaeon]